MHGEYSANPIGFGIKSYMLIKILQTNLKKSTFMEILTFQFMLKACHHRLSLGLMTKVYLQICEKHSIFDVINISMNLE
jgi:hypothetical protein